MVYIRTWHKDNFIWGYMTKKELTKKVAKETDVPVQTALKIINTMLEAIKGTLKKGQKVILMDFGTFWVGSRKARKGRNPRTGEVIKISAAKTPRFRPGKALKDVLKH